MMTERTVGDAVLRIAHDDLATPDMERFCASLSRYALRKYTVTPELSLSRTERSHSHPVLTINISNIGPWLLAVYVHEQMHWRLARSQKLAHTIIESVKYEFRETPQLDPAHVAVCRLEVLALRTLAGEHYAQAVAQAADRYHREYKLAMDEGERVDACLWGLAPDG